MFVRNKSKSFIKGGYENNIVVNDELLETIYWLSRYQNVHRLITHCSSVPKSRFKANGFVIYKAERITDL